MERQLVDALKGVNRIADLDEVSKDMISTRAYNLWNKYHKILDTFVKEIEELTTEEPELCHLVGINVLMSATDSFVMDKNKELGRKSPAKYTIVYGDKRTSMLLHLNLMDQIISDDSDEPDEEDTDDED